MNGNSIIPDSNLLSIFHKTLNALDLATAKHLNLPLIAANKRPQVPTEVEIIGYGRDL